MKTLEVPFREVEPIEEADKIITMYVNREHLDFKELPSNKAFYSPSCDRVVVPMKEQYENINEYYSTTFHELTHSTGQDIISGSTDWKQELLQVLEVKPIQKRN